MKINWSITVSCALGVLAVILALDFVRKQKLSGTPVTTSYFGIDLP